MRRSFFTLCSVAALLLSVAVCGLWVRSYRVGDAVYIQDRLLIPYAILYSGQGGLLVGVAPRTAGATPGMHYLHSEHPVAASIGPTAGVAFDRFGFGLRNEPPSSYMIAAHAVWFPHWFGALMLLLPPSLWLRARLRRHRRSREGERPCPA